MGSITETLTPTHAPKAQTLRTILPNLPATVITPFAATPYPIVGTPSNVLKTALQDAIDLVKPTGRLGPTPRVPFSLIVFAADDAGNVLPVNDPKHKYAGSLDDEMHYSASMLKIAAMYAAFELRAAVRRFADPARGTYPDDSAFFAALSNTFDPQIRAVALFDVLVKSNQLAVSLPAFRAVPSYGKIFAPPGFGTVSAPVVEFTTDFANHMRQMIVPSNNNSAGECIRRLSYSYLNAALMTGGFFQAGPPPKGIWLAGDFSFGVNPYSRIDSLNDGQVAQATTTREMANLIALIRLGELVNAESSVKMRALLREAQTVDSSWLDPGRPDVTTTRLFTIDMVKIGLGNLKPQNHGGAEVRSEVTILKWRNNVSAQNLTGEIAACWQNLRGINFNGVTEVINRAFSKFLQP